MAFNHYSFNLTKVVFKDRSEISFSYFGSSKLYPVYPARFIPYTAQSWCGTHVLLLKWLTRETRVWNEGKVTQKQSAIAKNCTSELAVSHLMLCMITQWLESSIVPVGKQILASTVSRTFIPAVLSLFTDHLKTISFVTEKTRRTKSEELI